MKLLDERKKELAEKILTGASKTQIAKELGISRTTLYEWIQDPEWQAYFTKLTREVDVARAYLLTPLVSKAAEVLREALNRELEYLRSSDMTERERATRTKDLVAAVKQLIEIERLDRGQPQKISESKHTGTRDARPAPSRLEEVLDALSAPSGTSHDPSETITAPSGATKKVH